MSEDPKMQTGDPDAPLSASQSNENAAPDQEQKQVKQQLMPAAELKALFNDCKSSLDKNLEHQDCLRKLNDTVGILTARVVAEEEPLDPEQSKFVYDELIAGVARRIVAVKTNNDVYAALVADVIRGFVGLLAQEIRLQTSTCEDLCDALRNILSTSEKFYMNHFKREFQANTGTNPSATGTQQTSNRFSEEEKAWRNSLVEGSLVDAIKTDDETEIKMWSRGKITAVYGSKDVANLGDKDGKNMRAFNVTYDKDLAAKERFHSANAGAIAQPGTYTRDESWRDNLKEGDKVDALDGKGKWQTATVVCREHRSEAELEGGMPMVKIGWRTYHPEGDKKDEMGHYWGLSCQLDEMIGPWTSRIMPAGTMAEERDLQGNLVPCKPYNIVVEQGKQTKAFFQTDEAQNEADMAMLQREGDVIFVTERPTCRSVMFTEMINDFGRAGGFEDILKLIASPKTTLTHVYYIVEMLSNCQRMYHKSFIDNYFARLADTVEEKLANASEAQLRAVRRERIDEIVDKVWKTLLSRVYDRFTLEVVKGKVVVRVGIVFLQQSFLEKRIDGAKMVDYVCKQVTNLEEDTSTIKQRVNARELLIGILRGANILQYFFAAKTIHSELVKRSDGLLRLLLQYDGDLTQKDVEGIWVACQQDDQICLDLYQVLKTISSTLKPSDMTFFINQIMEKSPEQVRVQEMELMQYLANQSSSSEPEALAKNQNKVMDFLWNFLFDKNAENYLDKVFAMKTCNAFSEILKNANQKQVLLYFSKIVEMLESGNSMNYLCIKVAAKFFREYSKSREDTSQVFADQLQASFEMFDLLFEELKGYMAKVKSKVSEKAELANLAGKKIDYSGMSDESYLGIFAHSDQLTERLNFIKDFARTGSFKMTKANVELMWTVLAEQNPLIKDHQAFYVWLRKMSEEVIKDRLGLMDEQDLISFFQEKINSGETDFSNLSLEGYYCIQSFFVLINKRAGSLIVLGEESVPVNRTAGQAGTSAGFAQSADQAFTAYSSETGASTKSYSWNKGTAVSSDTQTDGAKRTASMDPELLDVMARVPPSEMEGVNGLWKIAIDVQEKKVGESVIKLLLQLHSDLDYEIQDQLTTFENLFIESCFRIIQQQVEIIEARTPEINEQIERTYIALPALNSHSLQKVMPVQEKRIVRCLNYLKMLIQNSEKEGTHALVPHSALDQGPLLGAIKVTNSFQNGNGFRPNFIVQCFSNETIFSFRKRLALELSMRQGPDGKMEQVLPVPHPMQLRLNRFQGSTSLKEDQNGQTMRDLNFKANETFSVMQVSLYGASNVPLLTPDLTELNPRSQSVFSQIFDRYSIADPEQPDRQVMTVEEVKSFVECSEEKAVDDVTLVGQIMAWDADADGKITREDFITFYRDNVLNHPDKVRKNLHKHGFRPDLRMAPRAGDPDNSMQLRKSALEMPRFKIANKEEQFRSLFKLLDLNTEVHRESQSLINMICTNQHMFWNVLWLDERPVDQGPFSWDLIFYPSNLRATMYTLEIIHSILTSSARQFHPDSPEAILRAKWTERFLKNGGFAQLEALLEKAVGLSKGRLGQTRIASEESSTIKKLLDSMLKIMRIFITAAIKACKTEDQAETIHLLKKHSSRQEQKEEPAKLQRRSSLDTDGFNKQEVTAQTPLLHSEVAAERFVGPMPANSEPDITQELLFGGSGGSGAGDMDRAIKESIEMSGNAQEEDDSKEDFEKSERFIQLVEQTRASQIGATIVKEINFPQLQSKLLEIMAVYLQQTDKKQNSQDTSIILSCLSLWRASLIEDQKLIDNFYEWQRQPTLHDDLVLKADDLVLLGLFSAKGLLVRAGFHSSIELICDKVVENDKERPLFYMLNLLRNNFPSPSSRIPSKDSKYFFNTFSVLIMQYQALQKENPAGAAGGSGAEPGLDLKTILVEAFNRMKSHESAEKEESAITEDSTLVGHINLNLDLLDAYFEQASYEEIVAFTEEHSLMHEFFYENLYYLPSRTTSTSANKCKSKGSRTVGYKLLYRLIKQLKPKEMCEFLEFYLWPFIKDLSRPKQWRHQPSEKKRSMTGTASYAGMKNYGCICYMISMVQQFYMVPQFRYQLFKAVDTTPPKIEDYKDRKIDDNMLRQFQKLFGFLELSERQYADPFDFCFAFKDEDNQPTKLGEQKDAQEFLTRFFDRMETALKPTSQQFLMQDVFQGTTVDQKICLSCGNTRNEIETFYTFTLEVANKQNVDESLARLMDGEVIAGYKCSACNQEVDLKKRNLLGQMPNVLVCHLKRFEYDFETWRQVKVNTRYLFPEILDLRKYAFQKHASAESKEDENLARLLEIGDDEYVYRLVGVNIHRGAAQHGHYWSLINTNRGDREKEGEGWYKVEDDTWKAFDDEEVRFQGFKDIAAESYGGESTALSEGELATFIDGGSAYGKSAYMLVYERKSKRSVREVKIKGQETEADLWVKEAQRDKVAESLAKVERIIEAENSTEPQAHHARPEQAEQQDNPVPEAAPPVAADPESVEERIETLLEWKQIPSFIPEWIREIVRDDNTQFVIDRQVFHVQFFYLVKLILKHIASNLVYSSHTYAYEYLKYFHRMKMFSLRIGYKVEYEFLTHYYENGAMSAISDSMSSIFTFSDSYVGFCNKLDKEPSIICDFMEEHFIKDKCAYLYEVLFQCPDATARSNIAKTTSMVINKAFRILGVCCETEEHSQNAKVLRLKALVHEFMEIMLNQMGTRECQKNWTRLGDYYSMIRDIGTQGRYQAEYLLKRSDIVVDLCDLMLQQKSPKARDEPERRVEMGGSVNQVSFGPLVNLASHLVRSMHTPGLDASASTVKLYRDEKDSNEPKTALKDQLMISEQALEYFTNGDFVNIVMNHSYEPQEFGEALAHICYGNKKLSKRICQLLLKGIAVSDYHKIDNYLTVVEKLVSMKDKDPKTRQPLQARRLEWIFGFAYLNHQSSDTKIKFGLDSLQHNIAGEVYSFRSMLTYSPDDDSSLLHLIWRYQGRMENYTMTCLEHLTKILASDEEIMEYFSNLPGASYQYARYTDWIKPFLTSTLNKAQAAYGATSSKEEVVKLLSTFEVYEAFLAKKDGTAPPERTEQAGEAPQLVKVNFNYLKKPGEEDIHMDEEEEKCEQPEEDKKMMDDEQPVVNSTVRGATVGTTSYEKSVEKPAEPQTVIKCEPQPYIICQCKDEMVFNAMEKDGVHMQMSALACSFTASQPTGYNNLSVSQEFQNKYKPKMQFQGGTSARAMLQTRQDQLGRHLSDSAVPGYVGNYSALRVKKTNSMETNVDLEQQKGTALREEHVANLLAERNEEWAIQESLETHQRGPQEEECRESSPKPDTANQGAETDVKNIESKQSLDDSFEDWNGAELKTCQDLVYKLTLTNTTDRLILYKVSLSLVSFTEVPNLKWPVNGVRGKLAAGETSTVALLQKILPTEMQPGTKAELEKLDVRLDWKSEPVKGASKPAEEGKSVSFDADVKQGAASNTGNQGKPEDTFANDAGVGPDFDPALYEESGADGQKACGACTYLNPISATECEVCATTFN